ncbi:hypothetical protein V8C44DRAFT_326234 [Trichoderma aethiopicum]
MEFVLSSACCHAVLAAYIASNLCCVSVCCDTVTHCTVDRKQYTATLGDHALYSASLCYVPNAASLPTAKSSV